MSKKFLIFSFLIFLLFGCGTDYFYSSFYLRDQLDQKWPLSPSEQADLNHRQQIVGTLQFNQYNSPAIIATSENYILVFYESRNTYNTDVIGVDGAKTVNVNVAISKDAKTFSSYNVIGKEAILSSDSHGSPIPFLNRNGEVVVLSVTSPGFSSSASKSDTGISKSISVSNSGYRVWSEWEDLSTNELSLLLTNNFNRFYTNPGSGTTLGNGTLACIIDFKSDNTSKAEGFAILYSKDDGRTWQIGATNKYTSSHRFARIITERKDGKLLIAAVADVGNDYDANGALAWYLADSLNGKISSHNVTGLPNNSGGSISGGRIKYTHQGFSKEAILLLHSTPNRAYINPNNATEIVKNAPSLSISEDDGTSWKLITNIIANYNSEGRYDEYAQKTSFRQSLKVFKDGTIGTAIEEGSTYSISQKNNFVLTYRRFSLAKISDGMYIYEGL